MWPQATHPPSLGLVCETRDYPRFSVNSFSDLNFCDILLDRGQCLVREESGICGSGEQFSKERSERAYPGPCTHSGIDPVHSLHELGFPEVEKSHQALLSER